MITPDVRARMAPAAAAMQPYDPHFTPVEVNLSANENSFGLPAPVAAAVAKAMGAAPINRYPVPLADDLRAALAARHGVTPRQVIVGNGGDELLFNLFLAFGGQAHTLIDCPPTFSVYRSYAKLVGTEVKDVARTATFDVDVPALVRAAQDCDAALVVVTTPNNPTGNVLSVPTIAALCDAVPSLVVVDQAYSEFAAPDLDAASLLDLHPNLVILHTFSKAYALAGLRIGYVLASSGIASALAAVRQPYSVNVLAQVAARTVLAHQDDCDVAIAAIAAERNALFAQLSDMDDLGVTVFPSEANFLLVRVPDAQQTWERLRDEYSILVRNVSGTVGLEGCLRITVGTPDENRRLISALLSILE